jgi:hypothetical protein
MTVNGNPIMTRFAVVRYTLMFVAVTAVNVHASDIQPYSCRNGLFPSEQASLRLAKVSDKDKKLYFYDDGVNCPKNVTICKTKIYVVAGDELIVNKVSGDWACAWYNGKKSETVGWVKNCSLLYLPATKSPDISEWVGKWQMYQDGNEIIIGSKGDKLSVEGKAVWLGLMLDDGNRVVHTGDLDGEMTPVNGSARLTEGTDEFSCVADFSILGKYLIVTDNNKCGGMNVRFDGVYTK